MPHRRLPNSTPAILRVFKSATDTWRNTPVPADRAISPAQWALLDDTDPASLHSKLKKEASEVDLAQAAQSPLVSALSLSAARLTMYCSHFHQVFDFAVSRALFAPGDRHFYERDANSTALPDLSSYAAVENVAENIVNGEGKRQTAVGPGFIPMAMPSAAEVGTELGNFVTQRDLVQSAEVKTDTEREDVAALYPAAQALAVDLCDTVEFFYRKDPDPSSRRTKSRRWGVVYIYDQNEPVDPGDPTGQVTTEGAGGPEGTPAGNAPGGVGGAPPENI